MDLNDTPEQAEYRAKVRAWFEEHKGEAPVLRGEGAIQRRGRRDRARIASGSASSPRPASSASTWPKEYGGQGLGPLHQVILNQEIARAGVPGILDAIGVGMLGPTIIAHGSEEQKERYLAPDAPRRRGVVPALLRAGRRLRSRRHPEPRHARTTTAPGRSTARRCGPRTPTSRPSACCSPRTNADVPKHKGLTMFIVPMDAEGVTVRPLRQITGDPEFNEVFFDDVQLDPGSEVGPVDGGWGVALTTLMFERLTIGAGSDQFGYSGTRFAEAIAADRHAARRPRGPRRFGELATELLALRVHRLPPPDRARARRRCPAPRRRSARSRWSARRSTAGDLIADVLGPDALEDGADVARPHLVPARAEVRGRHRGDPAQHGRRARARPAAGAAARQGHPLLGARGARERKSARGRGR